MSFYSPAQQTWLSYAMQSDPQILPQLYNSFSQVQPIDPNQSQQFANNAEQMYMGNVVNPQVGSDMASGGITDNSFSASRAAADAAYGKANAQAVANQAFNSQNANQEALQSYNQMAQQQAWQGMMGAYQPLQAKREAGNPGLYAEQGQNNPMGYLYGGATMSPQNMLGRAASGGAGILGNLASGLGFGGNPGYSPMYGAPMGAPVNGNGYGQGSGVPNSGFGVPAGAPQSAPIGQSPTAVGGGWDMSGFGSSNGWQY